VEFNERVRSADACEALTAFFEKRPPRFRETSQRRAIPPLRLAPEQKLGPTLEEEGYRKALIRYLCYGADTDSLRQQHARITTSILENLSTEFGSRGTNGGVHEHATCLSSCLPGCFPSKN
jgi:hypothetical protein